MTDITCDENTHFINTLSTTRYQISTFVVTLHAAYVRNNRCIGKTSAEGRHIHKPFTMQETPAIDHV